MGKKFSYRVYEKTSGPEHGRGWYYEADGRSTGPFRTRGLADAAGNLWRVATERTAKGKP